MYFEKIMSFFAASLFSSKENEKEEEKAENYIDKVIKKNKETFDELAKH